jgi:ubiquitin conjugation factor E4 B
MGQLKMILRRFPNHFSYLILLSSSREPNADHDTIAPYLLRGPIDDGGICIDFIKEAIKRFDDDETFPAVFNDAMVKLSTQLSGLSMGDEYKPYVQVSL